MKDLFTVLGDWTSQRGLSGDEAPVARKIAEAFAPLCDDVQIDSMQSVCAHMGSEGPRVLIVAHEDEIGLMATLVEDDGSIRFTRVGGVDPRILPASRVTVYTEEGPMPGIVGALPPHLLTPEMQSKNYALENLHIDMGLPAERVKELVHPGTQIALYGPLSKLLNGRLCGKSIDDRGGVAVMLRTAELLKDRKLHCQPLFIAAVQEEVTGVGAATSAYRHNPDLGIVIDVTHAEMPECDPDRVYPLDSVPIGVGPRLHPRLTKRLQDTAKRIHVNAPVEVCPNATATDADSLQIAGDGLPTALINLPLKYMHTTVETISQDTIEEAARLLAAFLENLDAGWEEWLCC